jgi:iron complex transport system ATP-binding protein
VINIDSLNFGYGNSPVFQDLSIDLEKRLNIIIGPNAAGKSTLLKCIFGLLEAKGRIIWNGKDLYSLPKDERMEIMVYLPQEEMPAVFLTVLEITLLGKLPTLGWKVSESDINKVYNTLRGLNIESLAERYVGEISGGQKKLVSIAQTLVRDPKVILMDEPTNSLDMQKQIELFNIIHQIIQAKDIQFIIVMHDLNISCQHAEQLTILDENGGLYATGKPKDIVTEEMLKTVYGVEADVIYNKNGIPVVTPIRSVQRTRYFT